MTILLIALAAAILSWLLVAAFQPSQTRISRSQMMNAPAADIFPHVNELQKWQSWSPWVKLDPGAQYSFSGPASGVGASTSWVGKKSGTGTSTIVESQPNERILFRLDFRKPMKATSNCEFLFNGSGGITNVTWTMYGKNGFMAKMIGVFMNCEKMVGTQFEQGLTDLKALVEKK